MDLQELSKNIFKVEEIPDKGKGMVASQNIYQGDLILTETPHIDVIFEDYDQALLEIIRQFGDMKHEIKEEFANLFDSEDSLNKKMSRSKILRIFLANCVDIKGPIEEEDHRGVFLMFSRINHSCSSNAVISWSKLKPNEISIRASRNISVDEEITINYIRDEGCFYLKKKRKEILQQMWHFDCRCEVCFLDEEAFHENENIRRQILELEDELKEFEHPAFNSAEKAYRLEKLKLEFMYKIEKQVIHKLPFSLLECYAFGREMNLQQHESFADIENLKTTAFEIANLLGVSFIENCKEMETDIEVMLQNYYSYDGRQN
eukprot:GFUD01033282.1.p1 GENE.GFUD01033282.1~~GFUD01033282.1.p1  ORF type:complete len:318 (+),score=82.96 GFUD01033282.1:47-1000(+)